MVRRVRWVSIAFLILLNWAAFVVTASSGGSLVTFLQYIGGAAAIGAVAGYASAARRGMSVMVLIVAASAALVSAPRGDNDGLWLLWIPLAMTAAPPFWVGTRIGTPLGRRLRDRPRNQE